MLFMVSLSNYNYTWINRIDRCRGEAADKEH
jgi:hypothetical protein